MIRRDTLHQQPPPLPSSPARKPAPPRLPDASTFAAVYDADTESWSGQLLVRGERFQAAARTLFTLASKLDDLYRRSLKGTP